MSANVILLIAGAAIVVFATRLAPFLLFRSGKIPGLLAYLDAVLAPLVLVVLIVHCLKEVRFTAFPYGASEIIALAVVVALHLRLGNAFVSIVGGTAAYMILLHAVFDVAR